MGTMLERLRAAAVTFASMLILLAHPVPSNSCPVGWNSGPGSRRCNRIFENYRGFYFDEAVRVCETFGGSLPTLKSHACYSDITPIIQRFLRTNIQTLTYLNSRVYERKLRWLRDISQVRESWTNWGQNEPNGELLWPNGEGCLLMNTTTGLWYIKPCTFLVQEIICIKRHVPCWDYNPCGNGICHRLADSNPFGYYCDCDEGYRQISNYPSLGSRTCVALPPTTMSPATTTTESPATTTTESPATTTTPTPDLRPCSERAFRAFDTDTRNPHSPNNPILRAYQRLANVGCDSPCTATCRYNNTLCANAHTFPGCTWYDCWCGDRYIGPGWDNEGAANLPIKYRRHIQSFLRDYRRRLGSSINFGSRD